ncbi:MAG: DUF2634 domain-containing protein [Flavonifractor plautii]
MRQLFPIFQTTAPEGTAQALPLYWDVDMDYDKGVPRFSGGEPVLASGLEAVKGWAWRALHTERYRWSPSPGTTGASWRAWWASPTGRTPG